MFTAQVCYLIYVRYVFNDLSAFYYFIKLAQKKYFATLNTVRL